MATGRANKLTGQIGEFLVCAELGRRGFIATPFAGNVPGFDVVVVNERGRSIPLQVKTARGGDWPFDVSQWVDIRFDERRHTQRNGRAKRLEMPDLLYVFVWLSRHDRSVVRFFICSKRELQAEVIRENAAFLAKKAGVRPRNWQSTRSALRLADFEKYEDCWARIDKAMNGGRSRST